jgi:hypothetical protein
MYVHFFFTGFIVDHSSSVTFISLALDFFYSAVINSFTLSNICYNKKTRGINIGWEKATYVPCST